MQMYGKAWLTFVAIQCTAVSVVLGAYYGIKTNMIALKDEVHSLEQRVQLLERSSNGPTLLPPTRNAAREVAPASAAPIASATQPERLADKNEPPNKVAPGSASSEKPGERTTCVNKMTHMIFACEKAAKCLGPNNFDGTYFKNLRAKLGLGDADSMMICDEKKAEAEPSPVEGN
jgi:hypothetical protein